MNSLKEKIQKSSRTMAIITKVLCILLIVGLCIPIGILVWYAAAPDSNFFALRGLRFYSSAGQMMTSSGEILAETCGIILAGGFILYSLMVALRIFNAVKTDMMPFSQENTKGLKKIATALLIYSILEPISKACFYGIFAPEIAIQTSINIVTFMLALIFFFISVVFSYGAELQKNFDETL